MEPNCPHSPPRPKLVVEELPLDEKVVDDSASIKSYDAKDIAVDCGWQPCQDASGSHMDAYNAFEPEKFGYFPESVSGDEKPVKIKMSSKTVFEKILERFPGSFCDDETPAYGKQMYTVTDGVSYAILTTPAGKLIRIGDKILPLHAFLNFNCIEQVAGYVQCSNHLDAKNVYSFKMCIDDLEAILLHAASLVSNNVRSSCCAAQQAYAAQQACAAQQVYAAQQAYVQC